MAWEGSTRSSRLPPGWKRLRTAILERDGFVCQLRLPCCTGLATEADHIVPGDDHSLANLQAACSDCNAAKNHAQRPRPAPLHREREAHPGLR
jgi:5-methylcytosine-specific restriction endonuclease McrA